MSRLFDEHKIRKTRSLIGAWQMQKDERDVGRSERFFDGLKDAHTVSVPSVWNSESDMMTYEGVAWYEKDFYTEGGTVRICFGSVMTEAEVYLDGELLGSHYGGFLRFDFIKEGVREGYHRLSVRVDNSFGKHSIPQALVDWYHYGGITRGVCAELLSGISVLNVKVDYTLDGDTADTSYTLKLYNAEDTDITDTVRISLDGMPVAVETVTLSAHQTREIKIKGEHIIRVERWSLENPRLYTLAVETGTDDLIDRTGFRNVEVRDRSIYVNGKKTRLRGINRHEDHPDFGMAFPELLMHKDIEILERLCCNSVRGAHYPNNPYFLDLLDERGMTFWSEIPVWGGGWAPSLLADPVILQRGLDMHREMLDEHYNHPSIIIWGMHNEIDTRTEEALNMSRLYYTYLKENGGNRLVAYATNKTNTDKCFEYTDIICLNTYIGWYDYPTFSSWEEYLDIMENYIKLSGASDKPVVASEFGAAAIYGHHTFDNIRWTEEYQAELISKCIRLFFGREEYAGAYVWHFADARTAIALDRARGYNNKGVLNEYRRPKMAYNALREVYTSIRDEEEKA